jgi:hypothetical protein
MSILDEIIPLPPVEILQQKIDKLSRNIYKCQKIFLYRKKTFMRQLQEIIQLASDSNIDKPQLRTMISRSFAEVGISDSYLRKLLPESLKFMKHMRKDYVQKQDQRDQSIHLQQSHQQDSVESPTSGQLALASAKNIEASTIGSHNSVILHTEGEVAFEDKDTTIKNLKKVIKELEDQTKSFIAVAAFRYGNTDILLKILVNVKARSIGTIEITTKFIQKELISKNEDQSF